MIEFFIEQIENIEYCENCGFDLRRKRAGKNVAHILPKSIFKSVATEPKNIMYLCSTFDREDGKTGCHETFDSSWSKAATMPIWDIAKRRVEEFKEQVKEKHKILFNFE
jgi:hypothetical protein